MRMEEYGRILDYLPEGRATSRYKESIVFVVGEEFFTILEVTLKQGKAVNMGDRIYVGKGEREVVDRIKRRIGYGDLTSSAKRTLSRVLEAMVKDQEEKFVRFTNICGPVTIRQHQLELLPGIGKKHLEEILEGRKEEPFKDFEDIKKRVSLMPSPIHVFATRIEDEIKGGEKHYLFAKPPMRERRY